jgi:hypothetical protein
MLPKTHIPVQSITSKGGTISEGVRWEVSVDIITGDSNEDFFDNFSISFIYFIGMYDRTKQVCR